MDAAAQVGVKDRRVESTVEMKLLVHPGVAGENAVYFAGQDLSNGGQLVWQALAFLAPFRPESAFKGDVGRVVARLDDCYVEMIVVEQS